MFDEDAEKIRQYICPVCGVQRKGLVDQRRALKQHLKTVKSPDHKLWCTANYTKHFRHGGDNSKEQITRDHILQAIEKAYGKQACTELLGVHVIC